MILLLMCLDHDVMLFVYRLTFIGSIIFDKCIISFEHRRDICWACAHACAFHCHY